MVTAILPSLTDENDAAVETIPKPTAAQRASVALSVDSEVTITPERFRNSSLSNYAASDEMDADERPARRGKPSALAGYVGLFTGCGALVALSVFLPLLPWFGSKESVTKGQAVQYSFYVVGAISLAVAVFVSFGLRGIRGEEGKGWRTLFGQRGTAPDGSASRYSSAPRHVSPRG